jgi:DNA polymerase-3 subunit delta'
MNSTDSVKNKIASLFIEQWRLFVKAQPYGSLYQWLEALGIDKKQGTIGVDESKEIAKKLIHKPFEGGYQVMIIWMADRMNIESSNKILKLIEEPPKNTVILLLTENEESILGTIQSRCQKLQFPLLPDAVISTYIIENKGLAENRAIKISKLAHGDLNIALQLIDEDSDDLIFEKWFVVWVRSAFKAKGSKAAINPLIDWSVELAKQNRETQKKFLTYCSATFRQAMLKNYKADSLIYFEAPATKFSLEKFAPFIHQNNILQIFEALEDASYHITRNGNGKIIFTDLSIKLTRLIHAKQ